MKFRQTGRKRKSHTGVTVVHFLKTACLFFCVAGTLGITLLRSEGIRFPGEGNRIRITAHRGASHGAPENTRAAIELAIAEQADYAEIDVRMTEDGVPVLMHDRALFRTTGVQTDIDKVPYEEIVTYDAGIRYGAQFAGETVPGLWEVLEAYGRKIRFNIELKERNNEALVTAVVEAIEAYGLEERCVITSDSYEQLERVKKANPQIKTGYILSLVYGEIFGCEAADFFSIKSVCITEQTVKSIHEQGKEIHAWTVNKEHEIKRLRALGVDNIITDRPGSVRKIVQSEMQH